MVWDTEGTSHTDFCSIIQGRTENGCLAWCAHPACVAVLRHQLVYGQCTHRGKDTFYHHRQAWCPPVTAVTTTQVLPMLRRIMCRDYIVFTRLILRIHSPQSTIWSQKSSTQSPGTVRAMMQSHKMILARLSSDSLERRLKSNVVFSTRSLTMRRGWTHHWEPMIEKNWTNT